MYFVWFFNLTLLWKKGVSCKIPIFTNISFSFCQNFMKLHGYIIHLCGSCTMCLCFVIHGQIFSFDALSCKISILTNISISFCQNFMKLHSYIVHLKFHYVHLFFICAKLCYKEGCLLGLTLGFFFGLSNETFPSFFNPFPNDKF